MHRRLALWASTGALPCLLLAAWIGGDLAAVLFAVASVVLVSALALLGAADAGGRAPRIVARGLLALTLWLTACFVALWWLRHGGPSPSTARFGGLPATLAIQIYGVFLLPLPFVAWLYAVAFDQHGVSEADLDALRRLGTRSGGSPADETPADKTPTDRA